MSAVPPSHSVTLAWDASPSPEVAGYRVYSGTESGNYLNSITTPSTTVTISGLASGVTYFFAVTSYDVNGAESAFSDEINYTPGSTVQQSALSMTGQSSLRIQGVSGQTYEIEATKDLRTWTTIGSVTLDVTGSSQFADTNAVNAPQRFYRLREPQL